MTWSHEKELNLRFGENQAMQEALANYEMDQMMQRELSPYLSASQPVAEGNRAERRKQASIAKRAIAKAKGAS